MSSDEIKGICVPVSGAELRSLSAGAVLYHEERIMFYSAQEQRYAEMAKAAREQEPEQPSGKRLSGYSTSSSADPEEAARERKEYHQRRKRLHEFLRDHYPEARTYMLTLADLRLYGISEQ